MYDSTLFEKHTEIFSSDIGMYYCGKRINTKNHVYGPEIRSHFLIVLVKSGTAVLYRNDKKFTFKTNDMLFMFPGEKIHYEAKTDWSINWIGITGNSLESLFEMIGITRRNPIFTPKNSTELATIMSKLYDLEYDNSMLVKYKMQSLLYEFISLLLKNQKEKTTSSPVDSALQIIKYNFNNDLNINDIAKSLFLDHAYFSRLFKEKVGMSPKKYIFKLRMEKAKELLESTDYRIKEISITAGFGDPLYFSRIFYKSEGITPTEYRKKYKKEL